MSHPDQFYVSLVSDECGQFFKENSHVSFTNALPAPLYFEQPYSVALTEIYVPPFDISETYSDGLNLTQQKPVRNELMIGEPYGLKKRQKLDDNDEINSANGPRLYASKPTTSRKTVSDQIAETAVQSIVDSTKSAIETAVNTAVKLATDKIVQSSIAVEIAMRTTELEYEQKLKQELETLEKSKVQVQKQLDQNISDAENLRNQANVAQIAQQNAESELQKVQSEYESGKKKNDEETQQQISTLETALESLKQNAEEAKKAASESENIIQTLRAKISGIEQSTQQKISEVEKNKEEAVAKAMERVKEVERLQRETNEKLEQKTAELLKVQESNEKLIQKKNLTPIDEIYQFKRLEDPVKPPPDNSVEIQLEFCNARIFITPEHMKLLRQRPPSLNHLLSILLKNLYYLRVVTDDLRNETENSKLRPKFGQIMFQLDLRFYRSHAIPIHGDYFLMNIPISKEITEDGDVYSYRQIIIASKKYASVGDFIGEIFEQIPDSQRDKKLFLESMRSDQIFNDKEIENLPVEKLLRDRLKVWIDDQLIDIEKRTKRQVLEMTAVRELDYIQMLYVYSDIVGSHAYSNRRIATLRIIPFTLSARYEGVHVRFDNPEFYPLSRNYFDSIFIWINNREHELTFIIPTIQPVYIQLLFKKITD